jgi:deferrochelatase/peroxidase EfeB
MTQSSLQEGIYFDEEEKPGKFFCISFLRLDSSIDSSVLGRYLKGLWQMYDDLKIGVLQDLPGHSVPSGDLSILIGYGVNIFNHATDSKKYPPSTLRTYSKFNPPLPDGGGPILEGGGLYYDNDVTKNPATEDIVVQFIANTQLAVNRGIIETWKYLNDNKLGDADQSTINLSSYFSGFQRDDFRSWLDFHDGVSNMNSGKERLRAIEIKKTNVEDERWVEGGTYMSFLRLAIDLSIWRNIHPSKQEIIVGRSKLTGCPIVEIDEEGQPVIINGCPKPNTKDVTENGNEQFRDISVGSIRSNQIKQSHIHRANRKRGDDPFLRDSNRIFRQGYEFLENINNAPGFRSGLNFVSFQDTPRRLNDILTSSNWLGKTNFGGVSESPLSGLNKLISVRGAGYYLVPPVNEVDDFPGSSIFL